MAIGSIYVDGEPAKGITGKQMCEEIVAAGLFEGTAEQIWDLSPSGDLSHVFEMYWASMAMKGHKIEIELPSGNMVELYPSNKSFDKENG